MRYLCAALLLLSSAVVAGPTQIVDGNYLRYEGTPYGSLFLPCRSTQVWRIDGGSAKATLLDYYRNSRASQIAEMRATLVLTVEPIDKTENPDSTIDAITAAEAIVSISEDEQAIRSCRDASG